MNKVTNTAIGSQNIAIWHFEKLTALANMAYANTATWMMQNRKRYPIMLFWGGAIAVGIVCACVALSLVSQSAGALAVSVVMQTGAAIAVVFTLIVFTVMAVGTHNALKYRALNAPPETANALPAGDTWQPPSIAPDILICLLAGEDLPTFRKRAADIKNSNAIGHATWAAIIPPFKNEVMILTSGKPFVFTRGNEPWLEQAAEWCGTIDHTSETTETYRKYVAYFAFEFSKWATAAKMELHPEGAESIFIKTI